MLFFVCLIYGTLSMSAQNTIGLLHHSALAFKGYTLFAPLESNFTYLIDNCGEVVHQWEGTKPPAYTVYLLEDGSLLRVSSGWLERIDWWGEMIWYTDIGNDFSIRNHHDIAPLPNGNILVIAGEYFSIVEAIERGRNPATLEDQVSVDYIVEIEPVGTSEAKIVWEWHFWDHLIQDFDDQKLGYGNVAEHPELLDINRGKSMNDWTHINGIDYRSDLDQILISSPYISELYIVDHSTTSEEAASHTGGKYGKGGDFLWRWGNPQVYKAGTESDRKLFGQHDPKWIPKGYPNEGNISVFNNNFGAKTSAVHIVSSTVLEDGLYPIDQQVFLPKDFTWTFTGEVLGEIFFNTIKSGMQVQANGNVLVSLGTGLIFEVTAKKELVWAYQNPIVNNEKIMEQFYLDDKTEIFRAERYPADYIAFNNKDMYAKGILENENSLSEDCRLIADIIPTNQFSEVFFVYQPASNMILINTIIEDISVQIVDVFGRLQIQSNQKKINIHHLQSGLYFILLEQHPLTKNSFLKI